jgi:hypothetical protein
VINKSDLPIKAGSREHGEVALYAIEVHSSSTKIVKQNDYLFYICNEVNYLCGYVGQETAITLPANYNGQSYEIYQNAFTNSSDLTNVTIPNGVTSIGASAFGGCTSLTSVVIPNGVTSIGASAFGGCTSLTSVVIPNGVTSIGESAFYGCSSLKSVTIPNGVTSIGDCAFCFCTNLTSVLIPKSVRSMGYSAFYKCDSLTSITYDGTISQFKRDPHWTIFASQYTITCTDGTISKN